jgi:hypothetical protein
MDVIETEGRAIVRDQPDLRVGAFTNTSSVVKPLAVHSGRQHYVKQISK